MAKHEPWYKPRDENGDEELINWLGGRKNPPPQQTKSGGGLGCPFAAAPAVGVIVAAALLVAAR